MSLECSFRRGAVRNLFSSASAGMSGRPNLGASSFITSLVDVALTNKQCAASLAAKIQLLRSLGRFSCSVSSPNELNDSQSFDDPFLMGNS